MIDLSWRLSARLFTSLSVEMMMVDADIDAKLACMQGVNPIISRPRLVIIGSAEALPILCVRWAR